MSDDSSTTSGQTFDREKFIGGRRPPPAQLIPTSTASDPVEVTR